jgi:DNA polymerase III subunit epsilon
MALRPSVVVVRSGPEGLPWAPDRLQGAAGAEEIRVQQPLDMLHFAVIDAETTGYYPSRDRIVEIAIRRVDSAGTVLDDYSTLIDPERDPGLAAHHGITPEMLRGAPAFADIASDVTLRLSGAVWVGHNLSFETRFLHEEFDRIGGEPPAAPMLCTMGLCRHFGPSMSSHRLEWLCERLEIRETIEPSAASQARATALVLACLLEKARAAGARRLEDLENLGSSTCSVPVLARPDLPFEAPRRVWTREAALVVAVQNGGSFIASLVRDLKPASDSRVPDDRIGFYLHVLDRVLKDRVIDEHEAEELRQLAFEWELTQADARRAHEIYLGMLVATAFDDRRLTEAERHDLNRVADLLGISPQVTERMIREGDRRAASS